MKWLGHYLRFHLLYFVGVLGWSDQFIEVEYLRFQINYISLLNAKYPG